MLAQPSRANKLLWSFLIILFLTNIGCADLVESRDGGDVGDVYSGEVDWPRDTSDDPETIDWSDHPGFFDDWVECNCLNEEDMCSPHLCGRPGIYCGPGGAACPEGYRCREHPLDPGIHFCVCDGDEEECGIRCERGEDCPASNQICPPSPDMDICRGRGPLCEFNLHCPPGYYCDSGECEPAGELPDGAPCTEGSECFSGSCHDDCYFFPDDCTGPGVCASQCLSDDDCPAENEHCRRAATQDHNGCVPAICSVTCPSGYNCLSDECEPSPYCVTSGDCEVGDCVGRQVSADKFPYVCSEADHPDYTHFCKPGERLSAASTSIMCVLPWAFCWSDDDCEDPYECGGTTCFRTVVPGD
jgi:hypothetical protein